MGWCSTVLLRIRAPEQFIIEFYSRFVWRGNFNQFFFKGHGLYTEDFNRDYNTYSVHVSQTIHDPKLNNGAMFDKINAIKQSIIGISHSTIDIILSYSEYWLQDLCYTFKIWKDNFLCISGNYGVATNIKKIYKGILEENPSIKLTLHHNFDISVSLIENHDRIIKNYHQEGFINYLNGQCDEVDWDFMPKALRRWKMPYPEIKIYGINETYMSLIDQNNIFEDDNCENFTKSVRKKLKKMRARIFCKGIQVVVRLLGECHFKRLKDLSITSRLNGHRGFIADEYDFRKQGWPVYMDSIYFLIPSKNLITFKEHKDEIKCNHAKCCAGYYLHKYEGVSYRKDIRKWYKCKGCNAMYCSRKCQKIDWNEYNHKFHCNL